MITAQGNTRQQSVLNCYLSPCGEQEMWARFQTGVCGLAFNWGEEKSCKGCDRGDRNAVAQCMFYTQQRGLGPSQTNGRKYQHSDLEHVGEQKKEAGVHAGP